MIWNITFQMTQALEYLHRNNIVHRDVKALNVLLTKHKSIKLADLGISKIQQRLGPMYQTKVGIFINIGTPLYLAPELVNQMPYDRMIDVWAMGCIIYSLCCL
jgi:serine/threonine protein kinase